jgi:DNA-directed RNA polymerase specialized sigma24 family protein
VTVEELSALYHDGYHRFVRVAEAITRDTEEARDAVQEGFSNALRGLER